MSWKAALLTFLLMGFGCKSADEKLDDLHRSTDDRGRLDLGIYDAGLLVHEGFATLIEAEQLSLGQLGRAIHDCALILDGNEFGLCRADAVSALTHLATRFPLVASAQPLEVHPTLNQHALGQVELLDTAARLLNTPGLIGALQDADKVVAARALRELRTLTKQDFGMAPGPWNEWWLANAAQQMRQCVSDSQEPLRNLARLRFTSLAQARSVLGYVAARSSATDVAELRAQCAPTIAALARQVLVLGLQKALSDKDPAVRWEAYRGIGVVQDPSLAASLNSCWAQENSSEGRVRLLQATACFPSKISLATHLLALGEDDRAVMLTAHAGLQRMTGEDGVAEERWWLQWYERRGKNLWP